jgi:hypothetical protein
MKLARVLIAPALIAVLVAPTLLACGNGASGAKVDLGLHTQTAKAKKNKHEGGD